MRTGLLVVILLLLFAGTSCNRNRLKLDEKSLAKNLIEEPSRGNGQDSPSAGSFSQARPGIKFQEIRTTDPSNPPVIIDVVSDRKNNGSIKSSRLFKQIQVVRIQNDESNSPLNQYSKNYLIGMRHIYQFSRFTGIRQFDMAGNLVKDICTNNVPYTQHENGFISLNDKEYKQQFSGAVNACFANGNLYYQYDDRPANRSELKMMSDANNETYIRNNKPNIESQHNFQTIGETVVDFGKPADKGFHTDQLCILPGNQIANFPVSKSPVGNAPLLSILTTNGDTLCRFRDYDPVKNMKGRNYRSPDGSYLYSVGIHFHFKPAYNDTIFELIPPDKLAAKYILHFGNQGVRNATEGMDPQFNLKDKLLLQDLIETDKYLFITYTRDYPCPNTAKQGTLKYGRLIFDKSKNEVIAIYSDEKPYTDDNQPSSWPEAPEKNIINDLNGYPFFWPTGVTADNKPFAAVLGKKLLSCFKPGEAAPIQTLKENDMLIFIYK